MMSSSTRSALAEVQDRRLGEAADDLVGAGEDQVGAARERARRQAPRGSRGGSPRPRRRPAGRRGRGRPRPAPRSARRRRSRSARRASPPPRPARRRAPASSASGVTQCAMPSSGSISGATKVGRRPESTSPSMIEEWTLRWTTTRPRWGGPVASLPVAWARAMQIAWLPPEAPLTRNQLRCAPQASAASRWARWKGVGSGPTSIPSMLGGTSWRIAASPSASIRPGSAPVPLWPGDVEAPRVARDVGDERVEVGGFGLVGHSPGYAPCGGSPPV